MKINGKLTISRWHSSDRDTIHITFVDEDACIEFAEATLTPEQFALAITGTGHTDCDMEVRGLDRVGKKMEHDSLEFPLGVTSYDKNAKEVAAKKSREACPEGWKLDAYFGSQGSFFQRDGETWARCTIRRWVEKDAGKEGGERESP